MKRKLQKFGATEWKEHRGDFETCPHCNKKASYDSWRKSAHTLYLEPQHCRNGAVAVVSRCTSCNGDSWVHEPMSAFHTYGLDWPVVWKKAVQKYEAKVKLQALRDWGASLCWRCDILESGNVDYHAWRQCPLGSGPAESACIAFKEQKKRK